MKKTILSLLLVILFFGFACKKAEERTERPPETITIKVDHDTSLSMYTNQTYILDASTGNPNSVYSWGAPYIIVDYPGYYPVEITTDTMHQYFYVNFSYSQSYIYYPNSFSPNGNWINDFWYVCGYNINPENFSMDIYNSNDNLVFHSDDFPIGWNGHYDGDSNNELCPVGYYFYDVKWESIDHTKHHDTGMFQLIL